MNNMNMMYFITPDTGADAPDIYIRVFKDSLPQDIWAGYCEGFDVDPKDPAITSLVFHLDKKHPASVEREQLYKPM